MKFISLALGIIGIALLPLPFTFFWPSVIGFVLSIAGIIIGQIYMRKPKHVYERDTIATIGFNLSMTGAFINMLLLLFHVKTLF